MADLVFSFDEQKFNKLFPFYLLIGRDAGIQSCGTSIRKLFKPDKYGNFFHCFTILEPRPETGGWCDFDDLAALEDQLVVIAHQNFPDVQIRGQFESFSKDQLLFVGTPWFDSMEKMGEKNLFINDYAIHDSIVDLLHIIQTKEITNKDTESLLKSYNEQTIKLKARETELLNTSNRLTKLIGNLESGIVVEDEQSRVILFNQKFCELFGINADRQDFTGRNFLEVITDNEELFLNYRKVAEFVVELHKQGRKRLDYMIELADGNILRMDFIPITEGDEFQGHLWKFTDITETVRFERKLESQKAFYEQILNEIPADIAVFDNKHRYLFVNPLAIKDPALRRWIVGKTDEDYFEYRKKDVALAGKRRENFNRVVASRKLVEWEEMNLTPNQPPEYNIRKMYPVFNDAGELQIVIGYGINITERKKIEEKILESEARYKSIFDHSLALICTHDLNGVVLDVNATVTQTLGYTYDELVGFKLQNIISPKYAADFRKGYLDVVLRDGTSEGIMVALDKEGKVVYLLYQNYLLKREDGEPYIIGFSQNITDRIHAERALKKSEEKYRGIIANMNLGLVEVNGDNRIVYANRSFCEMSGFAETELVGEDLYERFLNHGKDLKGKEFKAGDAYKSGEAYEVKTKNKTGDVKWWLFGQSQSVDESGMLLGCVGVFLDISSQKKLENELTVAKYKAELNAKSKEIFLANMSHEIRTPMNAILGIGKLLQKTQLEPQQRLYLNTIHNAANNLLVILNDLLDFSKIEAGKLTLEKVGFDVRHLIDNVLQVLGHKTEEKGLLLSAEIAPNIEPVLNGDPYRVNQVLMNLIGNAIKFTESGSIRIMVNMVWEESNFQVLEFRIVDTGIGMSKDFVEHLFDKFSQEDESVTRRFGGTGLGMSISKQLIELMSGNIRVESAKGEGTVVICTVKFEKGVTGDLPKQHQIEIDTRILKGKKLLLVEDNEMNRLLAVTLLTQYGATVVEAENGMVATEKLRVTSDFDLVLMDMQMPVMGGIEATRYIRKNLDTNIPIIALTANAFKEEEQKCIESGMNDFISKPFDEHKFIRLVAQWVGREVAEAEPEPEPEEPEGELFDLSNLEMIGRGDKQFMQKMLQLFVETMPETLAEMKLALAGENYTRVGELAHRIKPSVNNLNIVSVETDVKSLEHMVKNGLEKKDALKKFEFIEKVIGKIVVEMKLMIEELN